MAKTAFKGTPVTLAGEFVKAGTSAPEFTLVKGDLSNYTLKDGKGKYLILNIFPSMDTGVCATSVRKFNQLVDPARKIRIGNKLYFGDDDSMVAEVIDNTTSRGRTLRFLYDGSHDEFKKALYALGTSCDSFTVITPSSKAPFPETKTSP